MNDAPGQQAREGWLRWPVSDVVIKHHVSMYIDIVKVFVIEMIWIHTDTGVTHLMAFSYVVVQYGYIHELLYT
jgi:hypothetical protein